MPRQHLRTRARLTALIRYVIAQSATNHSPISPIKLQLLCYLVDTEHFRRTGRSLTGATYRAQTDGPRPDGFRRILQGLLRREEIARIPTGHPSCPCSPCFTLAHWDALHDQLIPTTRHTA